MTDSTVPSMARPRILHISADFPDAWSARKTPAVQNLIDGCPELDHRVYSINRVNGFGGIAAQDRSDMVTTLVYRAPPFGILLRPFLNRLADWIAAAVKAQGGRIDLVHGHKLTIEGLVARRVARHLGCPYVCTVRGNTDQKYLRLKPGMHAAWRRVAAEAAWLFPVTPWIERYLVETLSLPDAPRSLLPTITKIDHFLAPRDTGPGLVTAFHLAGWKLKGMPNLLSAIAALRDQGCTITLDIIGSDAGSAEAALAREIARHGLTGQVTLRGAVPHADMPKTLNGYAAFVLPTLRETFGMVYLEALFAGVPILYSQDRGIDGFFDDQDVGLRCDPTSVASIAEGLRALHSDTGQIKRAVARLQQSGGLERFRAGPVCQGYSARVQAITKGSASNP